MESQNQSLFAIRYPPFAAPNHIGRTSIKLSNFVGWAKALFAPCPPSSRRQYRSVGTAKTSLPTLRVLSHRPDFDDVGYEMPRQILDAVLQRCRRRRAAGAGALHVEIDHAVLE